MSTATAGTDLSKNLNQTGSPERIPDPRPSFPGIPSPVVTPLTVAPEIKTSVGVKTIEGSFSGDRSKSALADAVLPSNPAVREPVGQSKVQSSKLDSPSAQKTVIGESLASHS